MSNQISSLKMGQKFKKTPAGKIPVDWEVMRLGEIAKLEYGDSLPEDKRAGGKVPVYGSNGIVGYHSSAFLKGPGIIIGRKGTVGAVVWSDKDFWPIDTTYYVTLQREVDFKWLYYLLSSLHLENLNLPGGVPGINREQVHDLYIPLPLEKEQNKISNILTMVDDLIDKVTSEIEKTEELKKGLMRQLLTRGIGHKKFKRSPVGKIPENWQVKSIDSIKADIKNAIVDGPFGSNLKTIHYRNAGIPVIQSGFVTSNVFDAKSYIYVDTELFEEQKRSQVLPGDIVMAKIGAQAGTCAILPMDHTIGILAGNSLKITTNPNKCLPEYLVSFLHYRYAQDGLGAIKTITAQPAISLKWLKTFEIPLPAIKEQQQIVAILSALDADIKRKDILLEKSTDLKKGLMNMLLTGKVRV